MKTYRVEFAEGSFTILGNLVLITILCLTVIGVPLGLALFPTLYQLVEKE
jgi:hypothetical protein